MRRAVIFDAFGTLLQIHNGQHPFRRLIKLGIAQGRRPHPDDAWQIMSNPWGIGDAAKAFGISVPVGTLQELESILSAEVAGIEPYPDALAAVQMLQSQGLAVAVCSNLAYPYGAAIRRYFPHLQAYAMSYQVGATKPHRDIYQACCADLGHAPESVLMIGDSRSCDRDGPRAMGICGFYLDRTGTTGDFADLVAFAEHVIALAGAQTAISDRACT